MVIIAEAEWTEAYHICQQLHPTGVCGWAGTGGVCVFSVLLFVWELCGEDGVRAV